MIIDQSTLNLENMKTIPLKTVLLLCVSALLVAFGVSNITRPNIAAAPNDVQVVDVSNDIHFFLSTDENSVTSRASAAVRQAKKNASVRARQIVSAEAVYSKLSKSTHTNGEVNENLNDNQYRAS